MFDKHKQFFSNEAILKSLGLNTQTWMVSQDEGELYQDTYICDCGNRVKEKDWDFVGKCCNECKGEK